MNPDLKKLPSPPKGQTGMTLDQFKHLPPPPKGQKGFSLSEITPKQKPAEKVEMPIVTGNKTGFINTAKDIAVGAGKSLVRGATGITGLLQSAGKKMIGGLGIDTSKMGLPGLDTSTPEGKAQEEILKSKSRAQQVGGALETATELGTGFITKGPQAISKAKQGYEAFKASRGATLVEKELKDTLETVRPKLTPTLESEAKAAGRGKTEGKILKKTSMEPSARETEMAQIAHEAGVSSRNTFDQNIKIMKNAQKSSAENLRSALRNATGSWNRNDIVKSLNEIKPPLTIKSDSTLTKLANNFKKAIVDIASGSVKKPEGLLDLRQGVDDLIEKEFPSNIYSKDTPVGQYIRKIRNTLNDLAESKLPEGKLPNGSSYKEELRRQHLLYDAIDNVAEKAPKIGESARPVIQKVKGLIKKHPVASGLLGGTALGGIAREL